MNEKEKEEDAKLDPAVKAARYHGVIQERLYLIKQIVLKISDRKHFGEVCKLEKAFAKELPEHFHAEEELLFPVIELRGTPEQKALMARLRREHKELTAQARAIASIFMENIFPLAQDVVERVNRQLEDFAEAVTRHAQLEDAEMFPVFHRLREGAPRPSV